MTNADLTQEQKEHIIETIKISIVNTFHFLGYNLRNEIDISFNKTKTVSTKILANEETFMFYGIIFYDDFTYSQVTDIIMVNRAYVVDTCKIATDLNNHLITGN